MGTARAVLVSSGTFHLFKHLFKAAPLALNVHIPYGILDTPGYPYLQFRLVKFGEQVLHEFSADLMVLN